MAVPPSIATLVSQALSRSRSQPGDTDVFFHGLSVEGAGQGVQESPTVPTAILHLLRSFNPLRYVSPSPVPSRTLLHSFDGAVKGGEMVMVIGKPGAGCSTFLKALANMRGQFKDITGRISYGGREPSEVMKVDPGRLAYCGENDLHFGSLSVDMTLRFAVQCKTGIQTPSRAATVDQGVSALAELFGLSHVLHTPVELISGGQRRRVSLAETLATQAKLLCFDNPTAGLDSSTAILFAQVIRAYVKENLCACFVSLYQSGDALSQYFDKVLVINNGHQIYFGPIQAAVGYFEQLGFYRPPGSTLSEFLTSMSGDRSSWIARDDFSGVLPRTAEDLALVFRKSDHFQNIGSSSESYKPSDEVLSRRKIVYVLPTWRQVYLCCKRNFWIHFTDRSAWILESIATVVQALVVGTIFFSQQANTRGLFTRGSALFFCVLIVALRASAELRSTFSQRPILLKQKALRFYRPGAYAIAQIIADMPWKILSVVYSIPLYFMVHFQWRPSNFFIWFLSLYLAFQSISMMFRAIAVFTVAPDRAALPVGIWLNVLIIYTGFYIPVPAMKNWLGWLRFLNPMYYAFESMMVNEFSSQTFTCSENDVVPRGESFNDVKFQTCAVSGSSPGQLSVNGQSYLSSQYGFQADHLWRNIGINAAFFVFFALCVAYGMERFKPAAGRLATVYYKRGALQKPAKFKRDIESRKSELESPPTDMTGSKEKAISPNRSQNLLSAGHTFLWQDLSLDIKSGAEDKRLLEKVTGWVKPGEMTALMGVSGAGKTTLMDTLAQRSSIGIVSGSMYLDGKPLPKSTGRRMAYVQQQDIHLPTSTVREALQMAAELRGPAKISLQEKHAYVEQVIDMLEMRDIAGALIGTPGAGLSLEKRKRVTIGVELAARPELVIFFDEPTSGLDSDSAFSIVRLMRKLSSAGQPILCTIHQPAVQLILQFDNLLLLGPGGKVAYFGPIGLRGEIALGYFALYGRAASAEENPAEYFIDIVNGENENSKEWSDIWKESNQNHQVENEVNRLLANPSTLDRLHGENPVYAASLFRQIRVVQNRAFTNYWREPNYAMSKVLMNLFNALLNGLTFLQLGNSVKDSRSRVFSLFVALITAPPQMIQLEPRFAALRAIFMTREKSNNTYHWSVFVISAIIVEIPYALFSALVYWILWYYTVGYSYSSSRAAYAWLFYELYALFYTSLGQGIASVMPTMLGALMMTPFIYLIVNTFAGPLSPPPLTPAGWRWFFNISPQIYLTEGMTTDFFHALPIHCEPEEISTFFSPSNQTCGEYAASFLASAPGYIANLSSIDACEYCPYATGDQYVEQYSFSWSNRGRDVGAYIGFLLFNWAIVLLMTYLLFIRQWRKKTA